MRLPRGIPWKDLPRTPKPGLLDRLAEMKRLIDEPSEPLSDPLAFREQLHREVSAADSRQGELRLPSADRDG